MKKCDCAFTLVWLRRQINNQTTIMHNNRYKSFIEAKNAIVWLKDNKANEKIGVCYELCATHSKEDSHATNVSIPVSVS